MCGFVGLFDIRRKSDALRGQVLKMSKQIRHRGPDWSGVYCGERAILSHERLSIVDPQSGGQPLFSCDGKQVLAVNGEIYNHQEIRAELAGEYEGRAVIGKCDVDNNDDIVGKFMVRNIPTIVFIKGGQVVDKQVGACTKADLVKKLEKLL